MSGGVPVIHPAVGRWPEFMNLSQSSADIFTVPTYFSGRLPSLLFSLSVRMSPSKEFFQQPPRKDVFHVYRLSRRPGTSFFITIRGSSIDSLVVDPSYHRQESNPTPKTFRETFRFIDFPHSPSLFQTSPSSLQPASRPFMSPIGLRPTPAYLLGWQESMF